MKLSGNRLRLSSGEIRKFKSTKKRSNFERVAKAYRHGWKPKTKTNIKVNNALQQTSMYVL